MRNQKQFEPIAISYYTSHFLRKESPYLGRHVVRHVLGSTYGDKGSLQHINFKGTQLFYINRFKSIMKLTLVLIFCFVYKVSGHARLISPPSRASMWRFGFPTPADYNDNEGFCGGYAVSTFVTFSITKYRAQRGQNNFHISLIQIIMDTFFLSFKSVQAI